MACRRWSTTRWPIAMSCGHEYGVEASPLDEFRDLHALILAVPHRHYDEMVADQFSEMIVDGGAFVDVKSRVDPGLMREDIRYWSL